MRTARIKLVGAALAAAFLVAIAGTARAAIKTETVTYKEGRVEAHSFIAYDDSSNGKRPGVLVIPEWWGLNDYPKMRAKMLAQLGYVAMAVDVYGDGRVTSDPKQAGQWAEALEAGDRAELRLVPRPRSPSSRAIRASTRVRSRRSGTASAGPPCWNSRAAAPRSTAWSAFMATTTRRIRPDQVR